MQRPKVILAEFNVLAQGVKNSVHVDSGDQYIELVGDQLSPGANMVYGTNSGGAKGWQTVSVSIPDGSITNAKLVNEVQATIKGRAAAAGTGVPQDLTASQVKTILAYAASEVSNTPAGSIAATTVQAAINELDAEKQPLDSDLTAIAALTPSNDDIIQRKAGVWTNRTPAQFKTDLALVKGDVGLGNVDNTSDVNKPVSTAQATAIGAKVSRSGDSMTGPLAMGTNKITGGAAGTNTDDFIIKSQLDAVSASISGKANVAQSAWQSLPLASVGWVTHAGSYHSMEWRQDTLGKIHFRGVVDSTLGPLTAFLSTGWVPGSPANVINKVKVIVDDNAGGLTSNILNINPTGDASFVNAVPLGSTVSFDDVSFWMD